MNKPRPSAVTLATGLTLITVGALVTLPGNLWFWAGLIIILIGGYQTITGVYRLAAAVDYIAARPVRRVPAPAEDSTP